MRKVIRSDSSSGNPIAWSSPEIVSKTFFSGKNGLSGNDATFCFLLDKSRKENVVFNAVRKLFNSVEEMKVLSAVAE
jgi:hypothetical protein